MATYEFVRELAAKWGFVYFAVLFGLACAYALRPSRKQHFDRAARLPLDED
jgi:cytochrome c oxidase cbb3-type subunit IV